MKARTPALLALVVLVALATAAVVPEHRVTTARLAVFAAAVVTAAELVRAAAGVIAPAPASPLRRRRRGRARAGALPRDYGALLALARLLRRGSTDSSLAAGRFGVVLRGVAAHRLARARGLDLDDPADADDVRAVLGDDLSDALRTLERRVPGGDRRPLELDLDAALDRLDRL